MAAAVDEYLPKTKKYGVRFTHTDKLQDNRTFFFDLLREQNEVQNATNPVARTTFSLIIGVKMF